MVLNYPTASCSCQISSCPCKTDRPDPKRQHKRHMRHEAFDEGGSLIPHCNMAHAMDVTAIRAERPAHRRHSTFGSLGPAPALDSGVCRFRNI